MLRQIGFLLSGDRLRRNIERVIVLGEVLNHLRRSIGVILCEIVYIWIIYLFIYLVFLLGH